MRTNSRTDSGTLAWQAVRDGLGIGVGICRFADREAELVRVLPSLAVAPLQMWLTVHRELRGTPRLKRVFDALAAGLGQP
jgi:DNA-binding transcriptional LysR family regulator